MTIADAFAKTTTNGHRALIPYFTAGYPSKEEFIDIVSMCLRDGADIVEIGIPFSDPVADGPTIQYASQQALISGITTEKTIEFLGELDNPHGKPLVIMSYLNPILQYGLKAFVSDAYNAGVRGLIIPDLICDEARDIEGVANGSGIDLIHLLAPTSTANRQRMILNRSRGFVYLVSVAGVTGARRDLPEHLNTWIRSVRDESPIPVAVGFGISNPEQAKQISQVADGVIVGSAIINILKNGTSSDARIKKAHRFVKQLKKAIAR
ncbi:MAG: tryptophan synthase subunit alpha [Candidatus Zixiibacteriota bacterium]|jgi:tryptophan synthase alpha chain